MASRVVGIASSARLTRMPQPAVDVPAEEADDEAGDRHAEGAGIDGEAHRGGLTP